ncbi:hypothetical protein FCL47_00860 [Desulfopila sp. IMCC35006]|uniref:hypothetical protein n=1 Tax=Desulfopila sp. IMCC35006 TaxID=2569542 RepID=UPI0010AC39F7|nr:hypothetical protein [Desulfopila sp. IMCC35006]TKB28073.1 hypothetical protein FCL47_00860 [Desulfopila sp. IMCC35006]
MKKTVMMLVFCGVFVVGSAMAMDNKSSDHAQHETQATMDRPKMGGMDHSQMDHGSSQEGGTFKHAVMVDGIHAEFQIMELASMNMSDPEGRTHHVMVSFMKDGQPVAQVVGKVKLIAPSGKEQIGDLKDFGSGVFAANFTIDEHGQWGVICLFKDMGGKHTVKFWYKHGAM